MAQAALDALIDTSPKDYFTRVGEQTRLQVLHAECVSAGLVPLPAVPDDVTRLYGLFNLAVSRGFGSLVIDYLAEAREMRRALFNKYTV